MRKLPEHIIRKKINFRRAYNDPTYEGETPIIWSYPSPPDFGLYLLYALTRPVWMPTLKKTCGLCWQGPVDIIYTYRNNLTDEDVRVCPACFDLIPNDMRPEHLRSK